MADIVSEIGGKLDEVRCFAISVSWQVLQTWHFRNVRHGTRETFPFNLVGPDKLDQAYILITSPCHQERLGSASSMQDEGRCLLAMPYSQLSGARQLYKRIELWFVPCVAA